MKSKDNYWHDDQSHFVKIIIKFIEAAVVELCMRKRKYSTTYYTVATVRNERMRLGTYIYANICDWYEG
jgi:hypothetical protein